jgi:pyruvate dehydrogenase E2 component (dihydrolipoamide acetyltransferase)
MPIKLTMPRLSDTMEQGTIIKWNVKEGDALMSGDVVADIETDKATMEMQVFDDGVMAKIVIEEGKQVPVGTLIAVVAAEGEDPDALKIQELTDAPEPAAEAPEAAAAPVTNADQTETPSSAPEARAAGPIKATPVARRLATEHDLDLASIQGSGPGGRIIKRDVLAAAESAATNATAAHEESPATPVEGEVELPMSTPLAFSASTPTPISIPSLESRDVPVTSMRQSIARRLVESKQSIPHYQVSMRFATDKLIALRVSLNEQLASEGVKLSVNDFIVRACALAMKEHPMFNASWGGDHLVLHGQVNIGVAVSLPEERGGGLVVATIRDADRKSLRMISAETRELASKARAKGLSIDEMSDTTFTISNLGMFGVDDFTAIINPPNSAILACGAALEQPVVRDHRLAVGWEMAATLSLDHRVIDGAMAARYLQTLKTMIEEPIRLLV